MGLLRRKKNLPPEAPAGLRHKAMKKLRKLGLRVAFAVFLVVTFYAVVNPPFTWTILREAEHPRKWVPLSQIAPVAARSVVAAEDANFCLHWGFDMVEIRRVIAKGGTRGASTITQQAAKNVFLWQGRSWWRKLPETALTPLIEAMWTKRRILEIYLNVAEFGPGVFGIHAAAQYHYATTPDKLTADQAARLAAILPAPKTRDPKSSGLTKRARSIADGAATIARDGRDSCFRAR